MKVLIANKYYYPRGGDCVYAIGVETALNKLGHRTAFFSMKYSSNMKSVWDKYWPSEVDFSPRRPIEIMKGFIRPFGDLETRTKFNELLDEFKPEVLHLNNIHTQLSPVIAEIAHKLGVKVVWTLHDYKLICPAYICASRGEVCELCIKGEKQNCTRLKCVKDSKVASWIAQKEATKWNVNRLCNCVDVFICPSDFLREKMIEAGFPTEKLITLHNYIDEEKLRGALPKKESHYCYLGRLSKEKGVKTLLSIAKQLPYELMLIGTGPLEKELRREYGKIKNIHFLGFCGWNKCKEYLASSRISVLPSEWYENNPLSVIESICLGTPVLGANIGGIPELIEVNKTGDLFKSGNESELKTKIVDCMERNWEIDCEEIRKKYSQEKHLDALLKIYKGEN